MDPERDRIEILQNTDWEGVCLSVAEKKWQTDQPWGKKRGNSHSTAGGKGERC